MIRRPLAGPNAAIVVGLWALGVVLAIASFSVGLAILVVAFVVFRTPWWAPLVGALVLLVAAPLCQAAGRDDAANTLATLVIVFGAASFVELVAGERKRVRSAAR